MLTKEQMKQRTDAAKRDSFNSWMNEPMVRAMISLMPPSEHLELLLRAAFDAGFGHGSVDAVIGLLEHLGNKRSE